MKRRIFLGAAAGLLSALVGLAVAYVVGIVRIAADLREFFPTLLAAVTVLPLMILFVLVVPTLVIGLLTGVTLGLTANGTSRDYLIGASAGLLFGLGILSGLLPLLFTTTPADFLSIVSMPLYSGVYALFLGLLTSRFFRWFQQSQGV